jgi:hypothetical protein
MPIPSITLRSQQPSNIKPPHFSHATIAGIFLGDITLRSIGDNVIDVLRPIIATYLPHMAGMGVHGGAVIFQ